MKSTIKILTIIFILTSYSCKRNTANLANYKYADKEQKINCSSQNNKLLNEAIYSFEDDIIKQYDPQNNDLNRAYSIYLRQALNARTIPYANFTAKHSVEIANALKNDGIYHADGSLNYQSELVECIASNIRDKRIRTTLNALLSTNSMRKNLFQETLKSNMQQIYVDKYLSLYVALEYYYPGVLKEDFSKVDFENRKKPTKNTNTQNPKIKTPQKNEKVDFNKRPAN